MVPVYLCPNASFAQIAAGSITQSDLPCLCCSFADTAPMAGQAGLADCPVERPPGEEAGRDQDPYFCQRATAQEYT